MRKTRKPNLLTHYVLVVIYFLLTFNLSKAQLADTTRVIIEDGWIEKMNDNISVKLSLNNEYEKFRVQTETNDIKLSPNINTVSLLSVNYRFLLLSVGFAPEFLPGNKDNDIKGKTKANNIGLGLVFRHWFNYFKYTGVQGFYLENTSDYRNWEKGDPYIKFPDLVYNGFSYSTGWRINSKASLKSLTMQTERQLKSAGSFVPALNLRYYEIDDQSTPQPGGATQKSNNFDWSLGFGYFYTFVFQEKFYASLSFIPNLGYIHTNLTTRYPDGDVQSHQNNFAFRWDAKGGLGYNGRDFFTGLYTSITGLSHKQENTTAVNYDTRVFIQVFVGLRLKSPRFLNNTFDNLENMILRITRTSQ